MSWRSCTRAVCYHLNRNLIHDHMVSPDSVASWRRLTAPGSPGFLQNVRTSSVTLRGATHPDSWFQIRNDLDKDGALPEDIPCWPQCVYALPRLIPPRPPSCCLSNRRHCFCDVTQANISHTLTVHSIESALTHEPVEDSGVIWSPSLSQLRGLVWRSSCQ